jgi:alanine-glyoxylate transaminase/serine-glyoxylate transaminase/serine-pyruvate transaminase
MTKNTTIQTGRNFLHTPGPTNIPDRVLSAMMRPAIDMSNPGFGAMVRSCFDDLKTVFKTEGEVFIYASNGHGAWEAALVNVLSPGDQVLVPEAGHFSFNWGEMARSLGLEAIGIPMDWRRAIDAETVAAKLRADKDHRIKAVLMVHTDTATSVTSDISAMRRAIDDAGHPALFMVDTIAALATVDFRMDEWGVDVAVGASQKGLMQSPGLGFTAASEKALRAHKFATLPRSYWDWSHRQAEEYYAWFCGTLPEHLLFGLREGLDMVLEEGLDAIFVRHARLAEAIRLAIGRWSEAGALELNAIEPAEQSDSVSTILVDEAYDAVRFRETCRDRFDVSLGGGLGKLRGRAFRIAHMGYLNEPMVLGALAGIEACLAYCDIPHKKGGVDAAIDYLAAK